MSSRKSLMFTAFKAAAEAIQNEGIQLRQLLVNAVNIKDSRELMQRFVPRLRPSQLDRLWKHVVTKHAEEGGSSVPRNPASEAKATVDGQSFMRIAFGAAWGAQE